MNTKPRETVTQNPPEVLAPHCRAVRAVCGDGEARTPLTEVGGAVAPPNHEFVLATMRVGSLRVKLLANEIDAVGVALKNHLISVDDAIAWLDEIGALQFIPEIGAAT